MAKFIHSVLSQNATVTAGTVITYDLPVNPLSFVLVTLKYAQNLANTQAVLANIVAMISKIEVLFRGSPIYSSNGVDLMGIDLNLMHFNPHVNNKTGADNELTSFTFLIPFGRIPYSPIEAFPRSTRGELLLQITYAASFTNIDAVFAQIETVELPEASPARYLRVTTLSVTPTATGEFDVELPIGNKIAAVLFKGTTIPSGATATTTIQYVQLLLDNQRRYFSQTNFETLRAMAGLRLQPPTAHGSHIHQIDGASFAQYMDTSAVKYAEDMASNHLMWDFDPLGDGLYLLETAGLSDVVARISAGDTNAVRVLPCELVGA